MNEQGPRWAREHTLLSSAARTSDGVSNAINAGEYGSCIFFLNITAASANSELSGAIQFSPDNETWFDSDHVLGPLGVIGKSLVIVPALGRYVRIDYKITGSVTFSIVGAFKS